MDLAGQAHDPLEDKFDGRCETAFLLLFEISRELLVLVLRDRRLYEVLLKLRNVLSLPIGQLRLRLGWSHYLLSLR